MHNLGAGLLRSATDGSKDTALPSVTSPQRDDSLPACQLLIIATCSFSLTSLSSRAG